MKLSCFTRRQVWRTLAGLLLSAIVLDVLGDSSAYGQRVFGVDTSSAANTNVSQAQWNAAYNSGWAAAGIPSFQFAFIRSNHGIPATGGTDDAQFYQNISRATNAGMLAGSYNYIQADVNTAVAEANHYLALAGMYMKPGYLLPVFDLEGAGSATLSQAALTTWSNDYINTIFAAKGIAPIVYTSSSFNNDEVSASVAWNNFGSTPKSNAKTYQWLARPSGNLLTGQPGAATLYPNPYGVWDPNFVTRTNSRDPAVNPWAFWQNGSDKIDPSNPSSSQRFLVDFNAANGNIEFVKDFLVPALWTNSGSGDWGTTSNWNSDNPTYNGTIQSGPAPRLPNNQNLDWVKLQNAGDGTVTISSGARTVRKFYTQQALNITGGSLAVSYVPGSGGQFDLPSEFNAAVTLSSGAAYTARTTQVDGAGGAFNVNGGTVTFTELQLASHASNSGKLVMNGSATFAQTGGAGTSVIRSTGTLSQAGSVTLSAGSQTFNTNNGSANVDLNVRTSVTGTGRLVKSGAGTMLLSMANTYSGGTTISDGVLNVAADDRLGTLPGAQASNIILDGGTLRTGSQVNSIGLNNAGSGYSSFPALAINGGGTNIHPASANILARISSIAVSNGGTNYVNQSSAPAANSAGTFVDIVGGGGTGATAFATVSGGVVTGVTITNIGSGYTSMPTIHISSTISGGNLAGSGATANVSGITLQSIAVNEGGFDYTSPTITLTGGGGSGAVATAVPSSNITLANARGVQLTSNGGVLQQTGGTTFTIPNVISSSGNGLLTKNGAGTLSLSAANTYAGGTAITQGALNLIGAAAKLGMGNVTVQGATSALSIQFGVADGIDDAAALSLFGGGVPNSPDQGYAFLAPGVSELVGSLLLNGVAQASGTYGSSLSSATFKLDEYFSGQGIVQVGPAGVPGDFNSDGVVDAGDYVTWRKNDGTSNALANDNGLGTPIGTAHYDLWRANFGNPPGSGSGHGLGSEAVPEPSTCLIAVVLSAIAMLPAWRRKR